MLISKHHDRLEAFRQVYWEEMGKYSLYIKAYKCELFTTLAKKSFNSEENGMRMKTIDRSATYDGACQKVVYYDPARCDRPTSLYGTISERTTKMIRFNTLWKWKGYVNNFFKVNPKRLQSARLVSLMWQQHCHSRPTFPAMPDYRIINFWCQKNS